MTSLTELAPGLHRWTLRHPEWHPGSFGAEVGCYAIEWKDGLLLVDPLLPETVAEESEIGELIASRLGGRLDLIITIPYHVRSAEQIVDRHRGDVATMVWGHRAVARRFEGDVPFTEMTPETALPAGARAFNIGKPKRYELPVHLPTHDAIVFGDAIVTTPEGELRVWSNERPDERKRRWYRDVFAPTLTPLTELGASRILVTHGEPILEDGAKALRDALESPPWYHHG